MTATRLGKGTHLQRLVRPGFRWLKAGCMRWYRGRPWTAWLWIQCKEHQAWNTRLEIDRTRPTYLPIYLGQGTEHLWAPPRDSPTEAREQDLAPGTSGHFRAPGRTDQGQKIRSGSVKNMVGILSASLLLFWKTSIVEQGHLLVLVSTKGSSLVVSTKWFFIVSVYTGAFYYRLTFIQGVLRVYIYSKVSLLRVPRKAPSPPIRSKHTIFIISEVVLRKGVVSFENDDERGITLC